MKTPEVFTEEDQEYLCWFYGMYDLPNNLIDITLDMACTNNACTVQNLYDSFMHLKMLNKRKRLPNFKKGVETFSKLSNYGFRGELAANRYYNYLCIDKILKT